MPPFRPLAERFYEKVRVGAPPPYRPDHLAYVGHPDLVLDACLEWTGSTGSHGYGQIALGPGLGMGLAHRVAWELVEPIPAGMHLDHLCLLRICVRRSHLDPVSIAENSRRQAWTTARFCRNGHRRTVTNTYIRPDKGTRQCLECGTLLRRAAQRIKRLGGFIETTIPPKVPSTADVIGVIGRIGSIPTED